MKCFCKRRKVRIRGNDDNIIQEKIIVQSLLYCPVKVNIASGMVRLLFCWRNNSGTKKSFQILSAFVIITVAVTGFINGKIIVQNVRYGPHPSINAASSSSLGTVLRNPVYKKITKGSIM